jgi:selenocysteine lyase/cysteine desulfurase
MDLEKIRADISADVVHLNNCGAGLMPQPVLDAVIEHLRREVAIGGYEAAREALPAIEHTYDAIAEMLNCQAGEIAVMENATVAWDMAFYGFPLEPGDVVLTAMAEYASNYIAYLQRAARDGIEIRVVPNDEHGQTDVAALANMIDDRVKLISITHAPTNGGLINPAAEIGKVARDAGVPYLLDACQTAGQMPLDVEAIGCDFLSATGRKYLRGPRGTGFLYVRAAMLDTLDPPVLDLHSAKWTAPGRYEMLPDARRFENWENYIAGKIGLGVAVDYALAIGLEAIARRVQTLADELRLRMAGIPGVRVNDLGLHKSGIISFSVRDKDPQKVLEIMETAGINISISAAGSTLLDMQQRDIAIMNRLGLHYYNTTEELNYFVETLSHIAGDFNR